VDEALLLAFYGGDARSPLTYAMIALTAIGSGWALLALVPLLVHRRARRLAVALALSIAAQLAAVDALKAIVGRTRPWVALGLHAIIELPRGGSFPSGHASGSFTVAAFACILLVARRPRASALAWSAGLFAVATAISASRVYLGAHWPTDVAAGAALGVAAGALGARLHLRAAALGRDARAATL
jgi:undecaprenyl-diphosphatase